MIAELKQIIDGAMFCLIFARGLDETELLRRLDGGLSLARLARVGDGIILPEDEGPQSGCEVFVGRCEGWAFAYGWYGPSPDLEIMRAISAGTTVFWLYSNINGHTRFCYAEDGNVLVDEDRCSASAMVVLAEAAGARLDKESFVEKPLLSSKIPQRW